VETASLRFFQRRDQVGERAVVDASAALGGGDRQADGQMRHADPWRSKEDHILAPLDEAELVQAFDLLPAERRLKGEVEVAELLTAGRRLKRIAACSRRLFRS
jgi:hypothetical protein